MNRIGVLMGGISAEREVSLKTGQGVLKALLDTGHDAVGIDWTEGLDVHELLRAQRVGVVWNALHGTFGEDGCVQGLLECLKIPYTGSGVLASGLAMDKVQSKRIFDAAHIPTPPWRILGDDLEASQALAREQGYPLVVKPSCEGSSVGVTIVHAEEGLAAAIAHARKCHGQVLLEKYIPGREVNVGILDDQVLGTVEIRPHTEFYDYEAKYLRNDTEYLLPAPLGAPVDRAVREAALSAHRAFGCAGYSRVDLRVDPAGRPFVLEVNTLPGMTGTSLLPKLARHAGLDYADLVVRILRSAALRA
jgi:D-alanine-D-alanine ligase